MSNYYEDQQISTPEIAVLAEDIVLPEITGNSTNPFYLYKDILGKFFLPIMTPMLDKNNIKETQKSSPSTKGHKGNLLIVESCKSTNYISLYIPKYILLNFVNKVPKGTEFIIASIGGSIEIEDMRIIGIYSLPIS